MSLEMLQKIWFNENEEGGITMYNVKDIANWFLSQLSDVTNKKLQKLVYYAYAWYLVFNNESTESIDLRFFENKFEAWVHGAVYPELYAEYKKYGSSNIPRFEGELANFSDDDLDLLKQVLEVYGKYTGNQLEDICHQESPWKMARGNLAPSEPSNALISDKEIFECYSSRL